MSKENDKNLRKSFSQNNQTMAVLKYMLGLVSAAKHWIKHGIWDG